MINIREVAKLAGVSPSTVSRVINGTAKASSIAVSRPGAVPSIPCRAEVEQALAE